MSFDQVYQVLTFAETKKNFGFWTSLYYEPSIFDHFLAASKLSTPYYNCYQRQVPAQPEHKNKTTDCLDSTS